jgi:succinyl-diaminopimelate desuccinylase
MAARCYAWLEARVRKAAHELAGEPAHAEKGAEGAGGATENGEVEGASERQLELLGMTLEQVEIAPGRPLVRLMIPAGTGSFASPTSENASQPKAFLGSKSEGEVDGREPLVFICHMDTVCVGEGWSEEHGPFCGDVVERDGEAVIVGRGSCDMKGGLACALEATAHVLARVGAGEALTRPFMLVLTCDEEAEMAGVEAVLARRWLTGREWCLDTEPTDGFLRVAHKGRTWFELTMHGVTAHASTPWEGADAIAGIARAICEIRNRVAALPTHPELGASTVTFGMINGGYQPYVVPDEAKVTIDMRLVPPATTQSAQVLVEEAIAKAEAWVPGIKGEVVVTGDKPAVERDPASGLVTAVERASAEVCGTPAELEIFTGYTDTAVIAARTGCTTFGSYGPGSLAMAHKPNEFVPVADIARVAAVLTQLTNDVLWE